MTLSDTLVLVHVLLHDGKVVGRNRANGNVADSAELTAVVQMFVFKSEKIPHESPANENSLHVVHLSQKCKIRAQFSDYCSNFHFCNLDVA